MKPCIVEQFELMQVQPTNFRQLLNFAIWICILQIMMIDIYPIKFSK